MRRPGRRNLAARFALEHGFTLVEELWVFVLGLIIFGAALTMIIVVIDQTASNTSQVAATDAVSRAMERVTRELRQATRVVSVTNGGATLTLHEYISSTGSPPATTHTVVWDCSHSSSGRYSCTRQDTTAGGAQATEVTGLTSSAVFSVGSLPSGSPATYSPINVTLAQAISGASDRVLTEQITPRSCQYAGTGFSYPCDNA